jgi:hypothetical protein
VSEIGDLIAILGEVDRALGDEQDSRRADVAALVEPYRSSGSFRWFDAFLEATEAEDLPSLREAMGNLDEPTRFASMLPRLLLAVAVVARVFPDQFGPGGSDEDLSLRALTVPGIISGVVALPTPPPDEPPDNPGLGGRTIADRARRLLSALADRAGLTGIEGWHEFVISHPDLISAQVARMTDPCSTFVIEHADPRGAGAIAVLKTELCVDGVSVSNLAGRFLQPENWPECSPWWCSLTSAPPQQSQQGVSRYVEVVAVFLDFATPVNSATRAVLAYNLSRDQSGTFGGVSANGGVDVDRGAIEVVEDGDHVRVTTTKRVRFTRPIDTEAIAAIACWVGYGDIAADLICNCAGGTAEAVDCKPEAGVVGLDVEVGSPLAAAVEGWIGLARTCTDEAGTHARAVATRLDTGSYTPDMAASDVAKTGALVTRGWAKLVMQSLGAVGAITRPPRPADVRPRSFALEPAAPEDCEFALREPLPSPFHDEIGAGDVGIVPSALPLGEHTFRLAIDSADVEGGYYSGTVVAMTLTAPHEVGSVPVDVIVP